MTPDSRSAVVPGAPTAAPSWPARAAAAVTGLRSQLRTGRRLLVLTAVLAVTVELAMAVTHVGFYARVGHKNLLAPKLLVRDADVDPFAYYDATLAMVAAQQAIPANATYTIVVGRERHVMVPALAISVYRFWLLPRHYTTDIHRAQWALTYWKSSEFLGVPYTTEIGLGPGVNAVKLRHGPAR